MLSDESKENNEVFTYTVELILFLTVVKMPAWSFILSFFETGDEVKGKSMVIIKIALSQHVSLLFFLMYTLKHESD